MVVSKRMRSGFFIFSFGIMFCVWVAINVMFGDEVEVIHKILATVAISGLVIKLADMGSIFE